MKHILTSFVATFLIQLVTIVSGVLTARLLLPEGKGALTAVMLWPSLLAYAGSLGLFDALTFSSANSSSETSKALTSGIALAIVLSVVLIGVGLFVLPLVWAGRDESLLKTARLYLAYIPINLICLSLMAVIQGRMNLTEYNFLRTFAQGSFVLGIIGLYAIDQVSVLRFAEMSLATAVLTLLISLRIVLRNRWLTLRPGFYMIWKLLKYGVKAHLGYLASLANMRLDQLLLSIFLPAKDLGLYVIALSISGAVPLAAHTLGLVAFPKIAHLTSAQNKRETFGRFVRLAVLLSVLTAVVLLPLTSWILDIFFGPAYLPATDVARILIIAAIPLGLNALFTAGFKSINRPLLSSQSELIGLVITGTGLWTLLPLYGLMAAAWVSLFAYSVVATFMVYWAWREMKMTPIDLFRPTFEDWVYMKHQLWVLYMRILSVAGLSHKELGG